MKTSIGRKWPLEYYTPERQVLVQSDRLWV